MYTVRGPECTEAGLGRVADARSAANLATGVAIGGTIALAAAVTVYLLAPRNSAVEVAPAISADGAGVTVLGRF